MRISTNVIPVLGLLGVILVVWIGWRYWRSRSKAAASPTKKVLALLGVLFLVVLLWIGWDFQPWMPAGRAVHLTSQRIGDYDFQVWQRKNNGIGEPFATGLFVRKQGGQWRAFLLDFEDSYRPTIDLRKQDSGIAVFYGNSRWGHLDEAQQVLKRYSNDAYSDHGVVIDSDPPGNWWLKESSIR
jgi:hypothetical protein